MLNPNFNLLGYMTTPSLIGLVLSIDQVFPFFITDFLASLSV